MKEYEVSVDHDYSRDSLSIKIRRFDKEIKLGLRINVTEEWIEKRLAKIFEGTDYPFVACLAEMFEEEK